MRTTSRRASDKHGTHTVVIPSLLGGNLPQSAVWEIEATATGFSLVYIGARDITRQGSNRPEPIPPYRLSQGVIHDESHRL